MAKNQSSRRTQSTSCLEKELLEFVRTPAVRAAISPLPARHAASGPERPLKTPSKKRRKAIYTACLQAIRARS